MIINVSLGIIIPFLNPDKWIGNMLDTFLDQDFLRDEYEIIVTDDNSTQCATTLKGYVKRNPIIKYHRKDNGGVSSARNMGIDLARGRWVDLCDSDDFVRPQVIRALLIAAETRDLNTLVCDWLIIQPNESIEFSEVSFSFLGVYTGIDYLASFASKPFSIFLCDFFCKKRVY